LKFDIIESTRSLALRLAERAEIDEVDAYLLVASYKAYALEGEEEDGLFDRVCMWYGEEVVAVGQVVMAVDKLSREELGDWSDMASRLRPEVMGDEGKYIEGLFRGWSGLAQKPLEGAKKQEQGLLW
jgi:nuclear pore complex protein Nup188